jgi:hypothetical protein
MKTLQLLFDVIIRAGFMGGCFFFAYQYDKHGTSPDNFQLLLMIVLLTNFFKQD